MRSKGQFEFLILNFLLLVICLAFFLMGAVAEVGAGVLDFKTLALVPIQEGGRVKPMDTFARESVRFITGHERFEGREPLDLVLDWASHPQVWDGKDLILVENLELRSFLQVPQDQKRVSPKFLRSNEG